MEGRQIVENGLGRKRDKGSHVEIKQSEEVLKKIIASHPLYEVLIQSHINCLKVISHFLCPVSLYHLPY